MESILICLVNHIFYIQRNTKIENFNYMEVPLALMKHIETTVITLNLD